MNRHSWIAGVTKPLAGVAVALLLQPANAMDEIVVYGKYSKLEIDPAALRVDLADYRKQLEDNVRLALADAQLQLRPVRVASTDRKSRG
jgi:hypothetical protein